MTALVGHQASTYVFKVYGGGKGIKKKHQVLDLVAGQRETLVEKSKKMN